ncbi:hypothetical protein N9D31_02355 [Oligoflexaceae bacterium]|nr:hypothetical protein [Oligoflexaceae bacterium]
MKWFIVLLAYAGVSQAESDCKSLTKGLEIEVKSSLPVMLKAGQSYEFEVQYRVKDQSLLKDYEQITLWLTMRNSIAGSKALNFAPDLNTSELKALAAGDLKTARKTLSLPNNFLGVYQIFSVFYASLSSGEACMGMFKLARPVVHTIANYASESDIWPPKILAAAVNHKVASAGQTIRIFFAVKDKSGICTTDKKEAKECDMTPHTTFVHENGTELDDYQAVYEVRLNRYMTEFVIGKDTEKGKITLSHLNVYDVYGNSVSAYKANDVVVEIK